LEGLPGLRQKRSEIYPVCTVLQCEVIDRSAVDRIGIGKVDGYIGGTWTGIHVTVQ
jgi:hypothetical protein